jgi:hypothetical protein
MNINWKKTEIMFIHNKKNITIPDFIMINEYPNAKTKAALITLFLLDLYWFILICKKAMKQF